MANLPDDWNEFLRLLGAHKVKFLVIGAHALAAHGRPRATLDLDLFVEPSVANAARLAKAFRDFGFAALAEQAAQLASGDRMASLGREPLRIDILNKIAQTRYLTLT